MDVDKAVQAEVDRNDKKPPRKPRPSEIAAKKAKAAKKKKPKTKPKPKAKKPKVRKPAAKKKTAKRSKTKPKAKKAVRVVLRPERLDMRLSKAEKGKVLAKAKRLRRTVTSVVYEAIERMPG